MKRETEHAAGCGLRWTILEAAGPRPVADSSLVDQQARDVKGDLGSCSGTAEVWVPIKRSLGNLFEIAVQIDLYAGQKKLDSDRTETISLG